MLQINSKNRLNKPLKIIIALIILCFLGCLIAIEIQSLQRLKEIMNWSTTYGVVTKIDYKRTSVGRISSNYLLVSYRYSINGREYENINNSYSPTISSETVSKKYAVGNRIQILYNPINHRDSALSKAGIAWTKGVIAAILLLSALPVIYTISLIIPKKTNK
jgi:Protein of unknown function (DUF3592)